MDNQPQEMATETPPPTVNTQTPEGQRSRSGTPVPGTPLPGKGDEKTQLDDENTRLKRQITFMSEDIRELEIRIRQMQDKIEKSEVDKVILQLWLWVKDCKEKRNAYWKLFYSYQRWNNLLSVPLLLISSATGITSVAQLGNSGAQMEWVVAILGVLSTALAAFQRYFRYGEKGEQSKGIAKRYALLARKGELQANLFESNRISMKDIVSFMEDFRKDLDSLLQEIDDVPPEILHRKHIVNPDLSDEEIKIQAMKEGMEDAGMVPSGEVEVVVKPRNQRELSREIMMSRKD
jgi:hypothetical protein